MLIEPDLARWVVAAAIGVTTLAGLLALSRIPASSSGRVVSAAVLVAGALIASVAAYHLNPSYVVDDLGTAGTVNDRRWCMEPARGAFIDPEDDGPTTEELSVPCRDLGRVYLTSAIGGLAGLTVVVVATMLGVARHRARSTAGSSSPASTGGIK